MANTWTEIKKSVRRERLLSVSNVMIMSLTFIFFGVFIYIIVLTQTSLKYLERQAQVTVFFKDDYPEQNILDMQKVLQDDARIAIAEYVSKEEAFRIYTELNKEDPILLESVTESILPASIKLRAHNISDLPALSDELTKIDGVEDVRFYKDVTDRFKLWSTVIYIVCGLVLAVLAIVSYAVIFATIRGMIVSRSKEIEIMRLVGASDSFIKRPFVYTGLYLGLLSSFIGSIIIFIVSLVLQRLNLFADGLTLSFLPSIYITPVVFSIFPMLLMILSGVILGIVGSLTTIRRYLNI